MKQWKITYQGCELSERDVTPLDYQVVSKLAEADEWIVLEPRSSPTVLIAWTVLAVARGLQCSVDDAMTLVNSQPLLDVLAAIQQVEVEVEEEPEEPEEPKPKLTPKQMAGRRKVLADLAAARARQVAQDRG